MKKYTNAIYKNFINYCDDEGFFENNKDYKAISKDVAEKHADINTMLNEDIKKQLEILLDTFSNLNDKHNEIVFENGLNFILNFIFELFYNKHK